MSRLGLLGCGNMGSAILRGAVARGVLRAREIMVYDVERPRMQALVKRLRVREAKDARDLVARSSVVLLAVKPQQLAGVARQMGLRERGGKLWISILAGTPLAVLKRELGASRVVRVMPNLGATAGQSFSACCGGTVRDRAWVKRLFDAVGKTVPMPEKHMDAVTALSGSGPAYFFQLMEWIEEEAVRRGIPRAAAALLAKQTAFGSSAVALGSSESPRRWRERVTSKGGTTQAALAVMKARGMRRTFELAIRAAVRRARELAQRS